MSSDGKIRDAIQGAIKAHKNARSWAIDVPPGWEHEAEDDVDTFVDPDGFGALQISTIVNANGDVGDADLSELIEDMKLTDVPRSFVSFGPFTGVTVRQEHEDGQIGDFWFLRVGPLLLFATYFSQKRHVGQETATVMKALRSLRMA